MKRTALAVLLAMTGMAYTAAPRAAPLSPANAASRSADASIIIQARGKTGGLHRSTGHLRTYRPSHVHRVRLLVGKSKVRPLAHGIRPHHRKRQGKFAYHLRPHPLHLPRYFPGDEGVTPEVRPIASEDHTYSHVPLSPDFCRYWGDRGELSGDVCW